MVTIAACQQLQQSWLTALAAATGGRTFATHESPWVWLPARRSLVLVYPQRISPAGIRPALAEARRLGARSASAWLNNAVEGGPLEAFGFQRGPQPIWMSAPVQAPQDYAADAAAVEPAPPEVTGPDARELVVGHGHPRQAWHLGARSGGKLVGRAWVYVPDTGAAGAGSVQPTGPAAGSEAGTGKLAGIFGLAVGPASRRSGFGSALLSRAAAVAETAGADRLAVNAAPQGQELCAARGFELIGRGQHLSLVLGR